MKINYDKTIDALYIQLKSGKVFRTSEKDGNILIDFDKAGNAMGVEVLRFSQSFPVRQRREIPAKAKRLLIPA